MNKKILKIILLIAVILFILGMITIFGVNSFVKRNTKDRILTKLESNEIEDIDCILVLGAGIKNNSPSPMLRDRLLTAIELYENKISSKMIMSGDHGKENYDEVNIMKNYAIERNVASEDIFMDHAGFSTYDSIYRAKYIFKAQKIIIVSQKYHLYRALYIAKKLGIDAYGVSATLENYPNQSSREIREILARNKDFFKTIFKPQSKYLGEEIPVWTNGNITNDKEEGENKI